MYYAFGMRDMLKNTQLNVEFFENLDNFQLHFIEMCFKQSIESQMGLMTEVELYNYNLFLDFKAYLFEELYGVEEQFYKKAG